MYEFQTFLCKVINTVKPAIAILAAGLSYLIIPDRCFEAWSIALWVSVSLDLLTRWFAIFVRSRGIWPAFKSKAFNSDTLFRKTALKVVAYLVIQILAGLSFRVIGVQQVNTVMAAVIYSFLFFRELISNIENLIEAGAEDLRPLLFWIKKKEKDVFCENKEKGDKKE